MPTDDTLPLRFDAELEAWVAEVALRGPAGAVALSVQGLVAVVDWLDPSRLVDLVVDLSTPANVVSAVLDQPDADSFTDPVDGATVEAALTDAAKHSLGWLAVALDRRADSGRPPTIWTAEALLLARRVGLAELLDEPLDPGEVEEVLDDLPRGLVAVLDTVDRPAADRFRAFAALVRSFGLGVPADLATATSELTEDELSARFADLAQAATVEASQPSAVLLGGGGEHRGPPLWCARLGIEALDGATATWHPGRRGATVTLVLGEAPPVTLWVQPRRVAEVGHEAAGPPVAAEWSGIDGLFTAEVLGLDPSADWALQVLPATTSTPPLAPPRGPAGVVGREEAQHWGRVASELAWAGRHDAAAEAWAVCSAWWRALGADDLAAAALAAADRRPASPFLAHRPALRRALEDLPSDSSHRQASTCDALGWARGAAGARAAQAAALGAQGDEPAAAIVAGLARSGYARLAARGELRRLRALPGGTR